MEVQCFHFSDALYIVQGERISFPFFGSARDTRCFTRFLCENSMHKRTFQARIYRFPNICMDTAGITRESCMASIKNNKLHRVFRIMRVKENSDRHSS